jgi:predicted regulator of Ras-like GTPase activity (Roadblock/LC7/MglB family)
LNREGAVLASGTSPGQPDTNIRAAVLASIWRDYEACIRDWSKTDDGPRYLLLRCEQGYAMVQPIGQLLVVLVTDASYELGMLKLKMRALIDHFKPLEAVSL